MQKAEDYKEKKSAGKLPFYLRPTKQRLDVRPYGDGSFFDTNSSDDEYATQGQIENRRSSGLDERTGKPGSLVHSKEAFTNADIREIAGEDDSTELTDKDKEVGHIIKNSNKKLKSNFDKHYGTNLIDNRWRDDVDKSNADYQKAYNKSRGFKN